MKKLVSILALAAMFLTGSVFADQYFEPIFGGSGYSNSVGGSQASSGGAGGAAIFGYSKTDAYAQSVNSGAANTIIDPGSTTSSHTNVSESYTGNQSFALGLGLAGSQQQSSSGGFSGASGTFYSGMPYSPF